MKLTFFIAKRIGENMPTGFSLKGQRKALDPENDSSEDSQRWKILGKLHFADLKDANTGFSVSGLL